MQVRHVSAHSDEDAEGGDLKERDIDAPHNVVPHGPGHEECVHANHVLKGHPPQHDAGLEDLLAVLLVVLHRRIETLAGVLWVEKREDPTSCPDEHPYEHAKRDNTM